MSYQALYRTYRPQQFKDIVGQEVVVRTLQQAIKNNKISHAYLFSGPRGTGKTSVARILAKTINCENSGNGEACQQCAACLDITKGNHPDVIEIDAASNNGVDEIRDLRDKVKFLPGLLKYKVYIIDEVHMLSQGAFNALLKTLEEPPKHAVFILATTEPQKIPATILSRCQRFDFKAIGVGVIASRIEQVVNGEEIKITEEAIKTIAENAEGGMRDALSILDQAISFSDDVITVDDVNAITGAVSIDKVIELAKHLEDENITEALKAVNELLDLGKEPAKLVNNLLHFYRDCLLYKNTNIQVFNKLIFEKELFKKIAEELTDDKVFYYVNILSDVATKIKFTNNPRIYLEVAFIKMVNLDYEEDQANNRILELEKKIESLALGGVNTDSSGNYHIDNEKVSVIEMKLNKVIHELNKLELHNVVLKVEELETKLSSNVISNESQTSVFNDKEFENLKQEVTSIKELLGNIEEQSLTYLETEITRLNNLINNLSTNPTTPITNYQYDQKEIELLQAKVDDLEDKLYKLMAGTFESQQSAIFGKQTKRSPKQIALFGDKIVSYDKIDKEDREEDIKKESVVEKIEREEEINPIKYEDTTEKAEVKQEDNLFTKSENENTKLEQSTSFEISKPILEENSQSNLPNGVVETKVEKVKVDTPNDNKVEVKSQVSGDVENISAASIRYEPSPKLSRPTGAYTTYDVRIIEKILHDSRTQEARADRELILAQWKYLDRGIDPSLISTAEILKEGIVGAVGNKQLILVFDNATTVNQVMRPRFKRLAKRIFENSLSVDVNYYMALPKDTWNEKRTEYINQYNIGIKYPTLQPINNPYLFEVEAEDDYVDDRQKTIEKTIEIFGEELVKVE